MLEIEEIQKAEWFRALSKDEKQQVLISFNVGSTLVPVAQNEEAVSMADNPGQSPTCLMNQEGIKGLDQRLATMQVEVFGNEGRGGLYKDLDEIKETGRRTEALVSTLTQEMITDRTRNNNRFDQIEKDLNNLGGKVHGIKTDMEKEKEKEAEELKEKLDESKSFRSKIGGSIIVWAIKTVIPIFFIGLLYLALGGIV